MFTIESIHYQKVRRTYVQQLLTEAGLPPEKLVMHRNRAITAFYLREKLSTFAAGDVHVWLEAHDPRIAIFKYPSERFDTGKFITLVIAFAAVHPSRPVNTKPLPESAGPGIVLSRLNHVSQDMYQLSQYAYDLASSRQSHKHMLITLEELTRQIDLLSDGLKQLEQTLVQH